MRNATVALLLVSQVSYAQLSLPDLSPRGEIHQQVGYSVFEIHYGRPAARERKIMGGLVPYGKLWRTGGGKCSTISFNTDVVINKTNVAAGAYAIVSIPGEKEWVMTLNSDTSKIYGDPSEYDMRNEVVRFAVHPEKTTRFYESLTFDLDISRDDAVLFLSWENTQVHFVIETGGRRTALAEIQRALEENPRDPSLLSQAAYYYYTHNEDQAQALQWITTALSSGEERWLLRQKFDVLKKMKNYPEARTAASHAIDFLSRTKPIEWEIGVRQYEEEVRGFSRR
jgi:hypothetical protein